MAVSTIFAQATAPGRAGIAVFRISGPQSSRVLAKLTKSPLPAPRRAVRRTLWSADGLGAEPIDDALVIWFPGPASFTGEDLVELHIHGSIAVLSALARELKNTYGLALAGPGEFTRRAFDNGKLDLTEVEGLADLIAAETEAQRRQAMRQAGGALSRLYEGWREKLVNALARLEAAIDFPDEDLPPDLIPAVDHAMAAAEEAIGLHLDDGRRGERLRDGLSIAILGAPNAGKSSLLNRLARREAAIVSAQAGTTRDVIELHLDLGGYPVTLADTAGLRETVDAIEAEGVKRAFDRAAAADLKLLVLDGTALGTERPLVDAETAKLIDDDALLVLNKADLAKGSSGPAMPHEIAGHPVLAVSALTGAGIEQLVEALGTVAGARLALGTAPALTRERHRAALERCQAALLRGMDAELPELKGEDLRLAVQALGEITGRVDVEEILDRIFREFCIGK
ncbi:tRNA uridine-5-carboxymethylaminomethyl(34) synthesis GTPase MnmE [Dongia soli]|uniref:tRNA modification GTPase MnmE n=1 Tax=Dongia soli TaxID=600628 RepID=A0ABU5E6Q6_9PROT|nr:tRNA uridine-5-carboxymethylaminomethyl(34) synthesis GTPase MnmE [Dongia soli]MDY0881956.1 tRNA uridine-5-carboxymethylaminomethyl(34) synthesis GTPase MnmE [Dongia soli]